MQIKMHNMIIYTKKQFHNIYYIDKYDLLKLVRVNK